MHYYKGVEIDGSTMTEVFLTLTKTFNIMLGCQDLDHMERVYGLVIDETALTTSERIKLFNHDFNILRVFNIDDPVFTMLALETKTSDTITNMKYPLTYESLVYIFHNHVRRFSELHPVVLKKTEQDTLKQFAHEAYRIICLENATTDRKRHDVSIVMSIILTHIDNPEGIEDIIKDLTRENLLSPAWLRKHVLRYTPTASLFIHEAHDVYERSGDERMHKFFEMLRLRKPDIYEDMKKDPEMFRKIKKAVLLKGNES